MKEGAKRGNGNSRGRGRTDAPILVPKPLVASMRSHAEKRGIHVNELARRLLENIVDDKLVDAVLDDLEKA